MKHPRICAVITSKDLDAIRKVEPLADLFELRIDLMDEDWPEVARQLTKPWIACNRIPSEGGRWQGDETSRLDQLMKAIELGAGIVDIELATKNLEKIIPAIKRKAICLISFHDLKKTPSLTTIKEIVQKESAAGADICKVVTTAHNSADNLTVLQLIAEFPKTKVVSFAMGPAGLASRILSPLAGGDFTYASVISGKESAPGQLTVEELRTIYAMLQNAK